MKISVSVADKPGIFSPFVLVGDVIPNLDRAVAYGYDAVELFILDPREIGIERIGEEVKGRGLAVSAIGPGLIAFRVGLSFSDPDPAKRRRLVESSYIQIRLAAQFGTSLNVGSTRGNLSDDPAMRKQQLSWIRESIQVLADYAGPLGVSLGVEPINRYETNYLNRVDQALEFADQVGRPNVGLLLDTFHMNIEERSIEESILKAKGRIVNVHLVDSNRCAPGLGHTDLLGAIKALKAAGYDGCLSMEILREPSAEEAAAQGVKHTRKLLRQAM